MKASLWIGVVIAISACAGNTGGGTSPTDVPVELTPQDQADAYVAVIQPQEMDAVEAVDLWIAREVCENAGNSPGEQTDVTCGPMDPQVQDALAERLPHARFTDDFDGVQDRIFEGGGGIIWRLGPVEGSGDLVKISASYYCGGLCAGGTTHVVELVDGQWTETGTEGPEWIS